MAGHSPSGLDLQSPIFRGLVRGMLPFFLLTLIGEGPTHALKMIRLISERGHGAWKPSPGSVYPILHRFEKEGLVNSEWQENKAAPRRVYKLTKKGRSAVSNMRQELVSELKKARHVIELHIAALEQLSGDKKLDHEK